MCLLVAFLSMACGNGATSSTPPATPSSPTTPTPTPPEIPDMAGKWTGTIASANLATRTITLEVFQFAGCVDGTWESSPSEWVGAISGTATADSFQGLMSLEVGEGSSRCTGTALISGSVGTTAIKWTATGFNTECRSALPQDVVVTLRRP